jgi:hypothetical protein
MYSFTHPAWKGSAERVRVTLIRPLIAADLGEHRGSAQELGGSDTANRGPARTEPLDISVSDEPLSSVSVSDEPLSSVTTCAY